jgi:hypothetical protein
MNWFMDVLKFGEKQQENTTNGNTGTQWLKDRGVKSPWHLVNHNCRKVYDIRSPSASPISWLSTPVFSVRYNITPYFAEMYKQVKVDVIMWTKYKESVF